MIIAVGFSFRPSALTATSRRYTPLGDNLNVAIYFARDARGGGTTRLIDLHGLWRFDNASICKEPYEKQDGLRMTQ